jgi:hypothetical protein
MVILLTIASMTGNSVSVVFFMLSPPLQARADSSS